VTAMDALDMGHRTKEQLWTTINTVLSVLNRIHSLPSDFNATKTVRRWVETIAALGLDEELNDDQCRQLRFDIDTAYQELKDHLSGGRSG
jgi:ESCRT-I complex subunit VPS28